MRCCSSFILFIIAMSCWDNTAQAGGIQIGRTRVIYDATKKEVALPVINKEREKPWLIQSWVDTGDGKTRGPFIITPPLFRLDAQSEQSLRIIWSGAAVPQDRESLFFVNVRTIPASDKGDEDKNVLRLIYKTRLKLFYRPKGLKGTPAEACKQLTFSRANATLQVKNASRYYVVFDSLYVGKSLVKDADTLAPGSDTPLAFTLSPKENNVSWRCITDYGNASPLNQGRLDQG